MIATLPTGTVTLLFTDIEGSTRLWEQYPSEMGAALAQHDALAAATVAGHAGSLIKQRGEGDSLFAVFARAADAVAAATALQRTLQNESWPAGIPLHVRMALHTGDATLREGDYFGAAVNRCARLRAIAHGGQVLLSGATRQLVQDDLPPGASLRDVGTHRLRDLDRPEQVFQLLHPDLPADFPPVRSLDARPNNLPVQPTQLVGREQEVASVCALLLRDAVRLVTLTGPGGTGKTRLGCQVAADLTDVFEDGVFLVELAPIRDPALAASALASVLGVREEGSRPILESVKEYLRERQILLVLDNFEQILDAAPLIAELLAAAPRLKVLVTSRAVLRLRGEYDYPVPPLGLPDPREWLMVDGSWSMAQSTPPPSTINHQPSTITHYPAVELFIERATAVRPDFTMTNENARAVAEICHRLDGLPLAIELAAARIRLFPPQALLARLEHRLQVLTSGARDLPARQQTLRDAIAWSYDLLDEGEKTLFRRLSVFVGGFSLEAAEAVCANESVEREALSVEEGTSGSTLNAQRSTLHLDAAQVLDGIASLVEKSLLRQDEALGGEPRFGMLETIREFASEKLRESPERATVCEQHRDWYLQWAQPTAFEQQRGADVRRRLDRLDRERDNLRAALEWSLAESGGEEKAQRLAGQLSGYWSIGGHYTEGRAWLARVATKAGDRPSRVRSRALGNAAYLVYEQGDMAAARALREEVLAINRELGDSHDITVELSAVGAIALVQGDLEAARAFLEESLVGLREAKAEWGIAWSLYYLGGVAAAEGEYATARTLGEESVEILRGIGTKWGLEYPLGALGSVAGVQGDFAPARALCEEGLAFSRELNHRRGIAWSLAQLGDVVGAQGEHAAARELFAESMELLQQLGNRPGIARLLEGFASLAAAQGQRERAARLLGASEGSHEGINYDWWQPLTRVWYARELAGVRAARDEASIAAAWAEGRAVLLEQAIAYALGEAADG